MLNIHQLINQLVNLGSKSQQEHDIWFDNKVVYIMNMNIRKGGRFPPRLDHILSWI